MNAEKTSTTTSKAAPGETTHFGYTSVGIDEKEGLVRDVFDSVAPRYDLMNDLMSMGVHRLWKSAMIDALTPRPDMTLLDVGGGTGDIAFRFLEQGGDQVTVCDINEDRGLLNGITWINGDAEQLPVPDNSYDAFTIAFCIRNVTRIDHALTEARRVLKPGGRFLCLEFSHVVLPVVERIYNTYSFNVLPKLGQLVAGDASSYQYLAESIRRFPDQQTFADMIESAGLEQVSYRNLSGGIAALHSAWRI